MDSSDKLNNFGGSKSLSKSKICNNLESVDFNRKVRINSPRSLEALGRLGYTSDDLSYISIQDFITMHPDLRGMSKDIIRNRYEFTENKRLKRIEEAKAERQKIIDDEEKRMNNVGEGVSSNNVQSEVLQNQMKSTAINNELKALERMKKKQEMELLNMVQFELKSKLIMKENEEKMRKQREKEIKYKQDLEEQHRLENEKKKIKEAERLEQLKKEEEERARKEAEKYLLEQKRMKEEQERERMRMREARIKQEKEKQKQEEFRKQIENMLLENVRKAEYRQMQLQEKDRIRKEKMEEKRLEDMKRNQEKMVLKQQQIERNMKNLDEKLLNQRENYLKKEHENDEKKQQFEYMRMLAFKEKKEKSEARSHEIKKVIMKNMELEQGRIELYNERQKKIQIHKAEIEEKQKIELMKKEEKNKYRDHHIKETLKNNENMENEKKNYIIEKINKRNEMVQRVHMMKERENMERSEHRSLRMIEKEEALKRLNNMQEYERSKTLERIFEKNMRIEEFKMQKSMIAEKKRQTQEEINRKKQEYADRFESIFKNKNIDDRTIKQLKEMFPDNLEINEMINALKSNFEDNQISELKTESKNLGFKKTTKSNQSNTFKTSVNTQKIPVITKISQEKKEEKKYEKLTQDEITAKVEEFKLKMNQNLLTKLAEERQKEDDREKALEMAKDSAERTKLETQFGLERAQASNRIVKYNEEMDKKIEEYERHLRSTNK